MLPPSRYLTPPSTPPPHPQSIVHSAVETTDSSVIAQLGWPDMRLPILYSMSWPHRVKVDYGRGIDEKFDFVKLGSMSFKVSMALVEQWVVVVLRLPRQSLTSSSLAP